MWLYGAVSKMVGLMVPIHVIVGSNLGKTFLCSSFLGSYILIYSTYIYICSGFIRYNMAKLVWRYSKNERGIIESLYKFCVEQKESGIKLSLECMWERIAVLTGISRSSAHRIVREKKKAMGGAAAGKATSRGVAGWLWSGCCTEDHCLHVFR